MELYNNSLKNITFIKVASIYMKKEIRDICLFIKENDIPSRTQFSNLISEKKLESIEHFLISITLKKRLRHIIMYMANELYIWIYQNNLSDVNEDVIATCLFWTSKGDIDLIKTMNNIKENNDISIERRFELCCNHCLEDAIIHLWNQLSSEFQQSFVSRPYGFSCNDYWIYYFRSKQELTPNFPAIDLNHFFNLLSIKAFTDSNTLAQMFFWQKLTSERKKHLFEGMFPIEIIDAFYRSNNTFSPKVVPRRYPYYILYVSINHWLWNDTLLLIHTYKKLIYKAESLKLCNLVKTLATKYPAKEELLSMLKKLKE